MFSIHISQLEPPHGYTYDLSETWMDMIMSNMQVNGFSRPIHIDEEYRVYHRDIELYVAAMRLGIEFVPVQMVGEDRIVDIGVQEDEAAFFDMEDEP